MNTCYGCGMQDIGDFKKVKLSDGREVNFCGMCQASAKEGGLDGVVGMPDDKSKLGRDGGVNNSRPNQF